MGGRVVLGCGWWVRRRSSLRALELDIKPTDLGRVLGDPGPLNSTPRQSPRAEAPHSRGPTGVGEPWALDAEEAHLCARLPSAHRAEGNTLGGFKDVAGMELLAPDVDPGRWRKQPMLPPLRRLCLALRK